MANSVSHRKSLKSSKQFFYFPIINDAQIAKGYLICDMLISETVTVDHISEALVRGLVGVWPWGLHAGLAFGCLPVPSTVS